MIFKCCYLIQLLDKTAAMFLPTLHGLWWITLNGVLVMGRRLVFIWSTSQIRRDGEFRRRRLHSINNWLSITDGQHRGDLESLVLLKWTASSYGSKRYEQLNGGTEALSSITNESKDNNLLLFCYIWIVKLNFLYSKHNNTSPYDKCNIFVSRIECFEQLFSEAYFVKRIEGMVVL